VDLRRRGRARGRGGARDLSAEAGAGEKAKSRYLAEHFAFIRDKILQRVTYPPLARRMGWQGKVVLSFQINRKGEVAEITLIQSSGYPELDEEGIATLRRASPFSPPPVTYEEKLEVEIPLVFRLEERR